MAEEIIEMFWKCKSCGKTPIGGRNMNCPSCGNPKDGTETYFMPDDVNAAPVVTDVQMLKEAHAGPNWECPFCHGHERDLNGQCRSCAGSRVDTFDSRTAPKEKVTDYYPEDKGTGHPEERTPLTPKRPIVEDEFRSTRFWQREWWDADRRKIAYIAGGVTAGIIFVVWLCVFLFAYHDVHAQISKIYWQHSIILEHRTVVHDTDWRSDMHNGAYNISCETRQRGTHNCKPYSCNYHSESYSCHCHSCNCSRSCSSNQNGYASCSTSCDSCCDTCSREVHDTCYHQCPTYEDWCSYDYDRWDEVKTETLNGNTHEEAWPNVVAHGNNERTKSVTMYQVYFSADDSKNEWVFRAETIEEFRTYQTGDFWNAKYNRVGSFKPLSRISAEKE